MLIGYAESERPRLTNGEIIFLCHNQPASQMDGQTDGEMTCDRKTTLCTKVHLAVKT